MSPQRARLSSDATESSGLAATVTLAFAATSSTNWRSEQLASSTNAAVPIIQLFIILSPCIRVGHNFHVFSLLSISMMSFLRCRSANAQPILFSGRLVTVESHLYP